jgi:hypothetical protein
MEIDLVFARPKPDEVLGDPTAWLSPNARKAYTDCASPWLAASDITRISHRRVRVRTRSISDVMPASVSRTFLVDSGNEKVSEICDKCFTEAILYVVFEDGEIVC